MPRPPNTRGSPVGPPRRPCRRARAARRPAVRTPCRNRAAFRAMLTCVTVADLAPTQDVVELRERYRVFLDEHILPAEAELDGNDALIEELRARAKSEGLWAPHLPPEAGGTGSGFLTYAFLNDVIGRSMW